MINSSLQDFLKKINEAKEEFADKQNVLFEHQLQQGLEDQKGKAECVLREFQRQLLGHNNKKERVEKGIPVYQSKLTKEEFKKKLFSDIEELESYVAKGKSKVKGLDEFVEYSKKRHECECS